MDYYRVLGLAPTATQYDVDLAYKKQASTHYPKTDAENRTANQKKFTDASQAYATLSDPARRDHYDQLYTKSFSKNDALKTFDNFFKEFDVEENEQ
jgi:DnaJ-class molecular chaperone